MKKYIILPLIIFALFVIKSTFLLDPDFGWHLKNGEYILHNGLAYSDQFSFTMPSYPLVYHEWLLDIFFALAYPILGMPGLSLIFMSIGSLALLVSIVRSKSINYLSNYKLLLFAPLVLVITSLMMFVGIRPQIWGWLLFSILLYICFSEKWKTFRYLLPFLFLLWANTHGSFVGGFLTLILIVSFRYLRTRRFDLIDYFLIAISMTVSLITPYGSGMWREVWTSISDSTLRTRVVEWMPFYKNVDFGFISYLVLSCIFFFRYLKKLNLEAKVIYIFWLIQSLLSMRHIPLWLIVSLPILYDTIKYFIEDLPKDNFTPVRLKLVTKYLLIGCIVIFVLQGGMSFYTSFGLSEKSYYPYKAIDYLKSNARQGQVFSDYGWGGYLIWKYPEKKVFIDGRMPSWRWNSNNDNELDYAMKEFLSIYNGKNDYKSTFEKFNIDTVLLPSSTMTKSAFIYSVEENLCQFLPFLKCEKNTFTLTERLKNDGWREVYKDNISVVFRKE